MMCFAATKVAAMLAMLDHPLLTEQTTPYDFRQVETIDPESLSPIKKPELPHRWTNGIWHG